MHFGRCGSAHDIRRPVLNGSAAGLPDLFGGLLDLSMMGSVPAACKDLPVLAASGGRKLSYI